MDNMNDWGAIVQLRCKVFNQEAPPTDLFPSVTHKDPYSGPPENLPRLRNKPYREDVWWFFAQRPSCDLGDEKIRTVDGTGYYLPMGDLEIPDHENKKEIEIVGFRRNLRFYRGMPPEATPWIIEEYRLNPNAFISNKLDDPTKHRILTYVACRLEKIP